MYATPRERAASALAAFAIVLLTVCALILGLRAGAVMRGSETLAAVFLEPSPRPQVREPKRRLRPSARQAAKGAPSPPNIRNKATQVTAPEPMLKPLVLPDFIVAKQAGTGDAAVDGASSRAGPGQGAGGVGNGLGGGGDGGDGDGDGLRAAFGPRQIRGRLSYRDMPEGLLQEGQSAGVGVRYIVDIDGRVTGCFADEPSGYPALDTLTCRLIEQRFRFRPARSRTGKAVRSTIVETHRWFVRPEEG